jgi:hypothetical protein
MGDRLGIHGAVDTFAARKLNRFETILEADYLMEIIPLLLSELVFCCRTGRLRVSVML